MLPERIPAPQIQQPHSWPRIAGRIAPSESPGLGLRTPSPNPVCEEDQQTWTVSVPELRWKSDRQQPLQPRENHQQKCVWKTMKSPMWNQLSATELYRTTPPRRWRTIAGDPGTRGIRRLRRPVPQELRRRRLSSGVAEASPDVRAIARVRRLAGPVQPRRQQSPHQPCHKQAYDQLEDRAPHGDFRQARAQYSSARGTRIFVRHIPVDIRPIDVEAYMLKANRKGIASCLTLNPMCSRARSI